MVSLEFLYFFLPVFMGVYALSGVRFRKAVFLLGTVVLCLWASTWGIIPMAVCAVVSYFCGRLIHRFADKKGLKRLWLILSVVANMAVLLVFIRSGHSSYDGRLYSQAKAQC